MIAPVSLDEIPAELRERLRRLDLATDRVRAEAADGARRGAMRRYLIALAVPLKDEADALRRKLEKGWAWLDRNAGAPKADGVTDEWVGYLRRYEAIEDALLAARRGLG